MIEKGEDFSVRRKKFDDSTSNPGSPPKKIWLNVWSELIGVLRGIEKDDDGLSVIVSSFHVFFNSEEAQFAEKFLNSDLIGKKIGILRTDLPQKLVLVRVIAERERIGNRPFACEEIGSQEMGLEPP